MARSHWAEPSTDFARAARVGSARSYAVCAVVTAAALATWHATGFFLAIAGVALLGAWALHWYPMSFQLRIDAPPVAF